MKTRTVPTDHRTTSARSRGSWESPGPRRHSILAALGVALLLTGSALAAAPVPVSPGTVTGGLTKDTCPTFLWSSGEGSAGYELVVYPVEEHGELAAVPALSQRLPAGAQGWTPSAEHCLRPGARYAWVVRDVGPDSDEAWSEPAIFEVTVPSRAEVGEAMETLRRYLAGWGGSEDIEPRQGQRHEKITPPLSAALTLPAGQLAAAEPGGLMRSLAEGSERYLAGESGHFLPPTAIYALAPFGDGFGVLGQVDSDPMLAGPGAGVLGYGNGTEGEVYGVWGATNSTQGRGVFGWAMATSGSALGVFGQSDSTQGLGVMGHATATTGRTVGLLGSNESTQGFGVSGHASASSGTTIGTFGVSRSPGGLGVVGVATAASGFAHGVRGESDSTQGIGVAGVANAGSGGAFGVFGYAASTEGFAGYFNGRVHVTGELSKGSGTFKIDHPLDPGNRYLSHSFVESPDMKNVYDGVVRLDEEGAAWVELPEYFGALNRDFRYQLTALYRPAPGLYVASGIADNRFRIAGGEAGMEVSWLVTGIRQDAYAERNPVVVEEDKGDLRGRFLHPEAHGRPAELAIGWVDPPEVELAEVPAIDGQEKEGREIAAESPTLPVVEDGGLTTSRASQPELEISGTEGDRP